MQKKKGKGMGPPPTETVPMTEALKQRRARRKSNDVKIWEERLFLASGVASPYWTEFQKNLDFYMGKQLDRLNLADQLLLRDQFIIVNRILASLAAENAAMMWKLPWFK